MLIHAVTWWDMGCALYIRKDTAEDAIEAAKVMSAKATINGIRLQAVRAITIDDVDDALTVVHYGEPFEAT